MYMYILYKLAFLQNKNEKKYFIFALRNHFFKTVNLSMTHPKNYFSSCVIKTALVQMKFYIEIISLL